MYQKNKTQISLLHLWLIPSSHNKRKPHIIRPSGLILIVMLILGLQIGHNLLVPGHTTLFAYDTEVTQSDIFTSVNNARHDGKVEVLNNDAVLNSAAQMKINDMFANQYWAHDAPSGTTPWHWFSEAKYSYQNAGENLAKNFHTSEGATNAWIASRAHRENMLNPQFRDMGVAVKTGTINGEETTLIVTLFGTRKDPKPAVLGIQSPTTAAPQYGFSTILASPAQIQTLANPLSILTLLLLLTVLLAALLTQWHYLKLPKNIRKSWYQHHALYTSGIVLLAISYFAFIFTAGSI